MVWIMEHHPQISLPAGRPAQRPSVLVRTGRSVLALMLREMSTTYGRSPGGYLWSLLEPIGGILILTFVLSSGLKLRSPSLGVSFAFFYATGMLPFITYVRTQQKVSQSISYSRQLLHYPTVTFFDAIVARLLTNLVTSFIVFSIIMSALILSVETRAIIDPVSIALAFAMLAAFALGIGIIHTILIPMFPIYASIWSILTTPLFFSSGVIYIYEELPHFGRSVLWYNPIIHITGMMRRGFFGQYEASFVSPLYVFSVSLVLIVVGYVIVGRYYRRIVDQSF